MKRLVLLASLLACAVTIRAESPGIVAQLDMVVSERPEKQWF